MLSTLFSSPLVFVLWAVGLILALSIHEFAHAFAADKLGDPTPRAMGRLTLDPRAHLDPLGTILIVLIGFGWGKPVIFDPYNLRDPRRDGALIALAGPASNLIFALVLSVIMKIVSIPFISTVFPLLILMNITLAIFNFVPVYPLDGEKILLGFLPTEVALEYSRLMQRYGTLILILLLLPITGGVSPISSLISPAISFVSHLLL